MLTVIVGVHGWWLVLVVCSLCLWAAHVGVDCELVGCSFLG